MTPAPRFRWLTPVGIALASVAATMVVALPSPAQAAFQLQTRITASDGVANDNAGSSVAIDGDVAVIGAAGATVNGRRQGATYVFVRSGDSWNQTAKLTASDGADGDGFGASVAIDGDLIVVGARSATFGSITARGAAYTFSRTGAANRTQTAKLTASDPARDAGLGTSVAIDGDTIVVGASGGSFITGAVYTFARTGGDRTQTAKLTASDGGSIDEMGNSVAIDGDTIVAGAPLDETGSNQHGSVYTFARTGGDRTQTAKLSSASLKSGDLGQSVAIEGDIIVAGAPFTANDNSGAGQGAVYTFSRTGGNRTETAKLIATDRSTLRGLGNSVALEGGTIAAGAPGNAGGSDVGAVYVFNRTGAATRTETAKLLASGSANDDRLGGNVALSGDTILAGASGYNSFRGSAVAFYSPATSATLSGTVTRPGSSAGVAGAGVEICNSSGSCSTQISDGSGQYRATGLPNGTYQVTAHDPAGTNADSATQSVSITGPSAITRDVELGAALLPPPSGTTITHVDTTASGLPVTDWDVPLELITDGCSGGTATYKVRVEGTVRQQGSMTLNGDGKFVATVPPLTPHSGQGSVEIQTSCSGGQAVTFGLYIDPSGVVRTSTGEPFAGAKVTLLRSASASGTFTAVPNGDVVMSPANRTNPDTTGVDGKFGWDVLAGFYKVRASARGCATEETPVIEVPPPATDLAIVLECTDAKPGAFVPVSPARLLDTRDGTGATKAKVPSGGSVSFDVAGRGRVPESGAGAAVLNVTVTNTSGGGFVTAYPAGATRPNASNLNFSPGQTIPNHVTVKLGTDGRVTLYNGSSGPADLIADVAGWYGEGAGTANGTFNALDAPVRLLDTREPIGADVPKAKVNSGATLPFLVAGATGSGVPASDVGAGVLNVTVTNTAGSGFLTAYPNGSTQPTASNLNFTAGTTIPNAATVKLGSDGKVALFNGSSGPADLIADISGWFRSGEPEVSGAFKPVDPARLLDTRNGTGVTAAKVPADSTVTLDVAGHGDVPNTGAGAAVLNVTVTNAAGGGFITVFPSGTTKPLASNLNFSAGQTIPNLVTVKLGSDGKVSFYNGSPNTIDLVADVAGWYKK